jgi:formylglycine-generating enzyme required for sulfatase activity
MALTSGMFAQSGDGMPFAVSPVRMNVMYLGLDNPLAIAIPGIAADSVSVTISHGTITGVSGGEYIARPVTSASEATVEVFAETDGQKKKMGSMSFRVKLIPAPEATVAGRTGGEIDKDVLLSQKDVSADMGDFLYDLRYTVTQFDVRVSTPKGDKTAKSNSASFTPQQKKLIKGLYNDDKVFIENIKALGTSGTYGIRDGIIVSDIALTVSTDEKRKTDKVRVVAPKIEMVRVKGGTFTMGCIGDDCMEDEAPAHQVTVDGFSIGKYEITRAQWKAVMHYDNTSAEDDNLPANVRWSEVQEFILKLYLLTGKQYRLPTEAEWEFAARGGVKSRGYQYSGSNNIDDVAWYYDNTDETDEIYKTVHPVGTKSPNELGIYDMTGN